MCLHCYHSPPRLNKSDWTTHWVTKIFLRGAICVAILTATLYQKSLKLGMNCIYQSDIWIYPMQICMTESHTVMLYTESCFRLSTSWCWCSSKTPSKNSNKEIYRYLCMKEISVLKTSGLQNLQLWSSVRCQSKLIWSKISWVTEIWKEQFVKGKMIGPFLGLKVIKEVCCRFYKSIEKMFSDQISQF